MESQLNSLLENLTKCEVIVRTFNPDHFQTLFDHEEIFEIEFNGFWSVNSFRESLHHLFQSLANEAKNQTKKDTATYLTTLSELNSYRTQIRAFKRQYFPAKIKQVVFNRVELRFDSIDKAIVDREALRAKIMDFVLVQSCLLKNLDELFKNTSNFMISALQLQSQFTFSKLEAIPKNTAEREIELQWSGSKTDFIELYYALYKVQYIKRRDGAPLQKKEMFRLMSQFFNVPAGNYNTLLNAAQNRKIDKSVLFTSLAEAVRAE